MGSDTIEYDILTTNQLRPQAAAQTPMARLPRYIIPGQPQHIIQRGNNRQVIFASDEDYGSSTSWPYTPTYG
jgi:hypothetical protein